MFDLGWTELLVIGVVALIVVGPKDLPVLFQQVGRFVGRAKGMAREFSYAMNQAADEAGVNDAAKGFKSATDGLNSIRNPLKAATDSVNDAVKSATKVDDDVPEKPSTLDKDRADAARRIHEATAKKQQERRDAELVKTEKATDTAEEVKDSE